MIPNLWFNADYSEISLGEWKCLNKKKCLHVLNSIIFRFYYTASNFTMDSDLTILEALGVVSHRLFLWSRYKALCWSHWLRLDLLGFHAIHSPAVETRESFWNSPRGAGSGRGHGGAGAGKAHCIRDWWNATTALAALGEPFNWKVSLHHSTFTPAKKIKNIQEMKTS